MRRIVDVGLVVMLCTIPLLADSTQQPAPPGKGLTLAVAGGSGITNVEVFMNANKVGDIAINPGGDGMWVLDFSNNPKPELEVFIEKCKDGVKVQIYQSGKVVPTDNDCDRAEAIVVKTDCFGRITFDLRSNRSKLSGCGLPASVKYGIPLVPLAFIPVVTGGGDPAPPTNTNPPPPTGTQPPSTPPPPATPPPPPSPPPTNTTPSSPAGNWRCTQCAATNDPDRHEQALNYCRQLESTFLFRLSGSTLHIEHPQPWVNVQGTFNAASRTASLTGNGPIGSFPNVPAQSQCTFSSDFTTAQCTTTYGNNGVFPGGRPFTVMKNFRRQ